MELLVAGLEPDAVESEVGSVAAPDEAQRFGAEGASSDDVVDIDRNMVDAERLHSPQLAHVTRTLIVGPIGSRPWISMEELVASLESIGHEVVVNGESDVVLPPPRPLPSRLGTFVNSPPGLLAWSMRMLLGWRRGARRSLVRAGIDQVLVWDEILGLLSCLARPPGVEVVWVAGPSEGDRLYQRVRRAVLARWSDRVVAPSVVPPCLPSAWPIVDGWVVFGSPGPMAPGVLERLGARAAIEPPRALVFSSREYDRLMPGQLATLCDALNPDAVWWSCDHEWIARLGGVPREAIDPRVDVDVDHRHLAVLGSGGAAYSGNGERLALPADGAFIAHDRDWAARVFAPGRSQ